MMVAWETSAQVEGVTECGPTQTHDLTESHDAPAGALLAPVDLPSVPLLP